MKWMVFSDTHLGSRLCKRHSDLLDLLKRVSPDLDLLVINGDFLDLWRTTLDKICRNQTLNTLVNFVLETLPRSGLRVVYVFGNHEDEYIEELKDEFPDVEFYWNYEVDRIKIIHGHQFDKSYTENRDKLYRATKIQQFFDNLFRIDVRKLLLRIDKLLRTRVYEKFVEEIHENATNQYSDHYEAVVVSHSHKSLISDHDGFKIFDTGNTYDKLNYIIFDGEEPYEVQL